MADDTQNNGTDNGGTDNGGTDNGGTDTGNKGNSLEALLSGLDDNARAAVLGEVHKARNEAGSYRTQLRDVQGKAKEYDKLIADQQSAEEKAKAETVKYQEKATAYQKRAVKAEVKALAASDFADADDAAAFLDLTSYVNDDGDIDSAAIEKDLKALAERKPHLRKTDDNQPRRPRADNSQGSGGNGRAPSGDNAAKLADFLNRQLTH